MHAKEARYVLVGGGSGGHITPLVAVAEEIRKHQPYVHIAHIGHKDDPLNKVTTKAQSISAVYEVSAGKFRRYYGDSHFARLLDWKSNLLNFRDLFRFIAGIVQSWFLLGKLKPEIIFMKGGYVCASVGIAARLRRIPYVTHDSDAMVSLAHKIIASGATKHLVAMPPKYYPTYDSSKTVQVGVPISASFAPASGSAKAKVKKELKLPIAAKVVLITGGGLGAKVINDAVTKSVDKLLADKNVYIVHLTGGKLYEEVTKQYSRLSDAKRSRIITESFTSIMHKYTAAADIIITRASATALTEFAAQQKACIVVPSPKLAGGHQLKNAEQLELANAALVVHEANIDEELIYKTVKLLGDEKRRASLGNLLHTTLIVNAAERVYDQLCANEESSKS